MQNGNSNESFQQLVFVAAIFVLGDIEKRCHKAVVQYILFKGKMMLFQGDVGIVGASGKHGAKGAKVSFILKDNNNNNNNNNNKFIKI